MTAAHDAEQVTITVKMGSGARAPRMVEVGWYPDMDAAVGEKQSTPPPQAAS